MRPLALLCTLLLLVPIGWAADPNPEPEDDNDAKKMLGHWELVKAEKDGVPAPGAETKDTKIEITKDQFIISMGGRDRKETATYKLDLKSKPRGIDIIPKSGGQLLVKGIYKFDKGELTMCWGDEGAARPTKFDDKTKGLMVLRKAKAKDKK